jgi:hypothetical protein
MGLNPVADGSQFMVDVAWRTWRKTGDTNLVAQTIGKLARGMEAVPRDPSNGLVFIKPGPEHDRCPYGFTDGIREQGDVLFCSLLLAQACGQLGDFAEAIHQDGEAERWRSEARDLEQHIRETFWDGRIGLFNAATVVCKQPDIWGSAFAVYLGAATPEQTRAVATYFKEHYGEIVKRGQIRHLPGGMYWEKTIGEAPGTYQNGGYWATPTGWFVYTLDFVDPELADRTVVELVKDFIATKDENEWIGDGGKGVPHYLDSATLPLDAIGAMQRRRAAPRDFSRPLP